LVEYQSALYVEPEYNERKNEEEVVGTIDVNEEENVEEECVEEPDEGELLVVRRDLDVVHVPNDQEQREAIFRSRCTIQGKVCSLIIDGGSCTNAASTTMVEKLQLEDIPHPTPYTIRWLSQGQDIRVDQRVLVSLSIGKNYKDFLWCDIIPMDTCHILLGRPWLFDRSVIHDGRANTYTLIHNQKKIILIPLAPSFRPKEEESHIVSIMKEEEHEHEECKGLVLTSLEESNSDPSYHPILRFPMKRIFHVHSRDTYLDLMVEKPRVRKNQEAKVIKVGCFMLNDKGKVVRIDLGSEKQREQPTFMVKKRKYKSYCVRELIGRKFKKFIKGIYDDFKAFKKKVFVKKASES
jgi:hypothetical protein